MIVIEQVVCSVVVLFFGMWMGWVLRGAWVEYEGIGNDDLSSV